MEAPAEPIKQPIFVIEGSKGLYCPECGSKRLYRDGLRYRADGSTTQRWLCRNCGYRFSENAKNEQRQKRVCRVGALGFGPGTAKNSARTVSVLEQKIEEEKSGLAGATATDIKGKIIEFAWHLQKKRLCRING